MTCGDYDSGTENVFSVFWRAVKGDRSHCYLSKYDIMMGMGKVVIEIYALARLCENGCIRVKRRVQ